MTTSTPRLVVPRPIASHSVLRWVVLYSILLGLCISPLLTASAESHKKEKPYALIFGTVWGPDGAPVYGVRVLIRRADQKKPKWEQISNHRGEFAQRVPAGKADYLVTADVKGLKSLNGWSLSPGDEATVHVEYDERVDTGLHLK